MIITTTLKRQAGDPYSNGIDLYAGKWIIGSVACDSASSAENKFKVTCKLPGIPSYLGNFKTQDDGKDKLENTLRNWIMGLGEQYEIR